MANSTHGPGFEAATRAYAQDLEVGPVLSRSATVHVGGTSLATIRLNSGIDQDAIGDELCKGAQICKGVQA